MIDQAGDNAGLVADLVQMAKRPVDVGCRNLADQCQNRSVHGKGREQRRR